MDSLSESGNQGRVFVLPLVCSNGILADDLTVEFSPAFDRSPHPDPGLESSIDQTWEARLARQPSLFNGSKFRYGGCKILESQDGHPSRVCLQLGLTDYKHHVGTALCPRWQEFVVPEAQDDVALCRHIASNLGNGAIVETSDNRVIVLQRGTDVGECPGQPVFPGGHPEPKVVGIAGHDIEPGTSASERNAAISREMFNAILLEILEETGIPLDTLSPPVFLGISRRKTSMRPTAFFYVQCALSSSEIQQHYATAMDKNESTKLTACTQEEVDIEAPKMPGCHEGGAELYRLFLRAKGLAH
ncbi:hypothetical protein KFL_000030090 [Klebsormidium nitens]|uniref:Nudix hydrolase domain-containing protein n=1 Tax=Klebsormidium nitens TaxID=105231 RepID=A0A1Y1HKS3_KLENI|nr:hypothetical protein KFL_000030090 [Klebsormidium nitens]|eukprot:GAQ77729.1 hypothetical protein KFL_000030090 [Klebsormidium nitens]